MEAGYLVKQGGQIKTWRKRYFTLSGLRLRWFESEAAAERHDPPKGEILCASLETQGKGKLCVRDSRGTRDLIIRAEIGTHAGARTQNVHCPFRCSQVLLSNPFVDRR